MVNLIDLLGRILISSIFLLSGYNKIFNYSGTISWMEGFGIPGFFLAPAIILEIILPIFIIIGYKTQLAATLLSVFCILTGVIFHLDINDQIQTIQYSTNAIIHWEGMTKEAYWNVFLKMEMSSDDWARQERYIQSPDYDKAKAGEDEYDFDPF